MTPQPPPNLDIASVAAVVVSYFIGSELAPYVSAYVVILFAWFLGVIIGRYRIPQDRSINTTTFMLVTLGVTLGATAFIADQLSRHFNIEVTSLLFPVAVAIPAVGHSWLDLAAWVVERWKSSFSKEKR